MFTIPRTPVEILQQSIKFSEEEIQRLHAEVAMHETHVARAQRAMVTQAENINLCTQAIGVLTKQGLDKSA